MTDKQSQNDEIEALESIYGNELVYISENHSYKIHIPMGMQSFSDLVFEFAFPSDYPSKVPPIFYLSTSTSAMTDGQWLSKENQNKLKEQLISMFVPNEVVIFQWIEWLRDNIFDFLNIKETEIQEEGTYLSGYENNELPYKQYMQQHGKETEEDTVEIISGEPYSYNKSKFIAHVAKVKSLEDVQKVVTKLKSSDKKIANATHNIVAYRFLHENDCNEEKQKENKIEENRDDDGEGGAGDQLLYLLQRTNAINLVVIVTRWYGGIKLGGDRFRIIVNVAKQLLQDQGYIQNPQISQKKKKK